MTQPVLDLADVSVGYGQHTVLHSVTLTIAPSEIVVLEGRSGSGKSTLLNAILGLVQHTGRVLICGQVLSMRSRTRLRRDHIGVIFQDHALIEDLSPIENVAIASMIAGTPRDEAFERAETLLVGLGVPVQREAVTELSGGEQQRTALARALIKRPALLLADEPTGSLDPATRDEALSLMIRASREHDCALLMVTHDRSVAARADVVYSVVDHSIARVSPTVGTA